LLELKGKTVAIRTMGGPEHVFLSSMAAYGGARSAPQPHLVTLPADESIELLRQARSTRSWGRPWSQDFCCMVAAHRDFVRQ
jgi:NitT/TauT family transport system substrate-binding protein